MRLAGAIVGQPSRHAATGKPPSEWPAATPRGEHHVIAVEREIDLGARVKSGSLSQFLRDHDLTFGPDSMSHTTAV